MIAMDIRTVINRLRHRRDRAPSLYDLVPHADALPRSLPRVELVPAEEVVGTTRQPSTLTADFLPRPEQRTAHWRHDMGRILAAQEDLTVLPPVELLKAGCGYFVVDGHKRVAAARRTGAVLDAIVVELHAASTLDLKCA